MAHWLFQANPKYSRILTAIQDLPILYWLVTRYADEITAGDRVLIWIAGKRAGIYAIAHVLESPHFLDQPPDLAYWITPMRAIGKIYVPVQFSHKFLNAPLLKSWLQHDPILHRLQVLRAPQSTNFRVNQEEWQQVEAWLDSIPPIHD